MRATLLAADHLPPASLPHARELRDDLRRLLASERAAAADFLLALADFDARRGWEPLGHTGLFPFLKRELGLSNGAAHLRSTAVRLIVAIPEVEAALRSGQLCLSSVGELARVVTPANQAEVLPRFFGCSFREARDVAAALAPVTNPPRREVVTRLPATGRAVPTPVQAPLATFGLGLALAPPLAEALSAPSPAGAPPAVPAAEVRTHELAAPRPIRALPLDDCRPLDADLRRLSLTVHRRLLDKVAKARDGLSHALPGATTEQVLEAALDLLLERQARAKALVKRPRAAKPTPVPAEGGDPRAIPASVEREVRLRDGDRCQFPMDSGGVCGSTWQVELDHVVPVALGGPATAANLRVVCAAHNRYAARLRLGEAVATERGARRRAGRPRALE